MAGQVITIGRQCGSGGHTIGEQVAKILGVVKGRVMPNIKPVSNLRNYTEVLRILRLESLYS